MGPVVGVAREDRLMWIASDDSNPVRRISFGEDQVKAELFAAGVPGWSAHSDTDRRWLPITGRQLAGDDVDPD